MRRSKYACAHLVQAFEDRHSKRSALCRIGTGAKLIKQNQGMFSAAVQNPDDIFHMRGKGAEAL